MDKKQRDEMFEKVKKYDDLTYELGRLESELARIKNGKVELIQLDNKGIIYNEKRTLDDVFEKVMQIIVMEYQTRIMHLKADIEEL